MRNMMPQTVGPRLAPAIATLMLALVFLTLPAIMAARADVPIQKVVSDKGVTAWLVEDHSVPIIALRLAFSGGSTQDPAGKEGLAALMTGLFDEGAGDLDSNTFQERLDEAGAAMSFDAGSDAIYGSLQMLADNKDEALDLLRLAVQSPRFDTAPVGRIRAQMVAGIQAGALDPSTSAQDRWARAMYGDHPYGRRDAGTEQSLGSISSDDLKAFHSRLFARGNLHIGVVGAIDAETLKRDLDKVFGDLPAEPRLTPIAQVEPALGQEIRVEYDLPQTTLQLAYPGLDRDAPDFFAGFLMNHILGGGTFTSRLFDEVRERRGLAYEVGSSLINREHASSLVIGTATRSDRADQTLSVIRDVIKLMAEEGPTEAELAAAKKYVIGAYAINNLATSSSIAATLVGLQMEGLGTDYLQKRAGIIEAVTIDQVKAVAKKLLTIEPTVMIVGPAAQQDRKS